MRTILGVVVIAAALTGSSRAEGSRPSWPDGVARICARALLFDGQHAIGTEQGALSVARDIRASTARRLARVRVLPSRPRRPELAARWLRVERRLAGAYARSYVDVWYAIAAANSPRARAALPKKLERLLHRPDRLRTTARGLESRLRVPDCTGGDNTTPASSLITGA